MRKPIKCEFTSVWSDRSVVTTPATYYPEESRVEAKLSSSTPEGYLEREFIEFEDGDTLEVCPDCHEYVLKLIMVPGIGHTLNEHFVCPNHDCPNHE